MYDPVAQKSFSLIDCQNNLLALEMDIRLSGDNGSGTAYLLELYSSELAVRTIAVKNNAIYTCDENGAITSTKVCDLSSDSFTNVKVIVDATNNTKDIYVNGTLVLEDLALSSGELESFAPTAYYVVHYTGTNGKLDIDNFKGYYVTE
jgi:hypothetical protein